MKNKIRKSLLRIEAITFTSPQDFAKWILQERKQKKLFYKNSNEDFQKYNQDVLYIKELFWQIICSQYLLLLKVSINEENMNIIGSLIKGYRNLESINPVLSSFSVGVNDIRDCAGVVLKQTENIINNGSNFVEETEDINNFFYMLRHHIGHGAIPELRRFASNLSNDLKK